MNRIEENNHKMEQEATDIFDAFINAAEIEVKEEPRVEIYRVHLCVLMRSVRDGMKVV